MSSSDANIGSAAELRLLGQSLRQKRLQFVLKRLLDAGVASVALLALAPVFLLVSVLVRISSPGPVIFRQFRIGLFGRPFVLFKFRTMRVEPDPISTAAQEAAALRGVLLKTERDPRVTRLGQILRSTSMDELPQLFNVFKGDMSLVGPRPLLAMMLEPYLEFSQVRCLVPPGLTGLWQIRERGNNTTALAMQPHDLEYIRRFSLALDLVILLRTPLAVASRRGAC
jgi:exopolysaccharide production protein ExoY